MSTSTARLMHRFPPRLRMFVRQLFLMVVAWLATAGLVETVRSGDYPGPLIFAALVIGCALHAIIHPPPLACREAIDE
jgi:hypothetical protein